MTCFRLVALGKFPEEFVYLVVKICHRGTLPSATPSFQVGKNFENRKKHQRRRIAWVGQADFGKLELNNRNHGGKCQHLSAKRDQFETRSSWNNRRNFLTFALSLWTDEATTTFRHFNVFAKTLYDRAIHKLVILCYFNLFTGTLYQGKYRHRFVILRAKCSLCSQALYFLYFSHPPETGKGGKRSYAKWSDYEEIMFSGIWPTLVLNVSKQRQ